VPEWVSRSFGVLETAAKTVGIIAALLAALSFALPPLGKWVDMTTAQRFGAIGFVYYEIDKEKAPTDDGQLYLLRPGSGLFEDIAAGDKLQAARLLGIGKTTLYRKLKDYATQGYQS